MKGLKEYIEKHGKHFTIQLAHDVAGKCYSSKEIDESLQKKVYYNVSGCTAGDVVYMFNILPHFSKKERINFTLYSLKDIDHSELLFPLWVLENEDFDFTPYI